MSFLHGGSRSLLTKAVVRSVVPRVAGRVSSGSRSLASRFTPKRVYCGKTDGGFEALRTKTAEEEIARIKSRSPGLFGWLRGLLRWFTIAVNAISVWYIHQDLHKDNPTWVSYLAAVPLLNWIPLLDIAQLERAWVLVPISIVAFASVFYQSFAGPIGVLAAIPMVGIELFRNYHILSHFEAFSWPTLVSWSLFRIEWIIMGSLAILGTGDYQLVPHKQRSASELATGVIKQLDAALEDPQSIPTYNTTYWLAYMAWNYLPFLRQVPGYVSAAYSSSGAESVADTVSDKVSTLLDLNSSTSSTTTPTESSEGSKTK